LTAKCSRTVVGQSVLRGTLEVPVDAQCADAELSLSESTLLAGLLAFRDRFARRSRAAGAGGKCPKQGSEENECGEVKDVAFGADAAWVRRVTHD
jgi:hypothetical protein